jgi:hypothetical protein
MEVTREPSLDARVLTNNLNELASVLSTVIQPTASVDDVILLENAQTRSHRRSMTENEHTPSLTGWAFLHSLLEPFNLIEHSDVQGLKQVVKIRFECYDAI